MNNVIVSPSLICADLNQANSQIEELLQLGIDMIHVDWIDGKFSPDIPMTLEQFDRVARQAEFPMDFHIMAMDNETYIEKALQYPAKQICFQCESSIHTDRMLNLIRKNGVKCGVALAPATPLHVLEYAAEICDFVLLMLINPGYASAGGERMVPYAYRKIADCREFLDKYNRNIPIEVDGRVSIEATKDLVAAGADILVSGSTGMFTKNASFTENYAKIREAIASGLAVRKPL